MTTSPEEFNIALAHHRAGRLRQAEQLYQEILRVNPQHPDALNLLGLVWHQSGNHEAALDSIRRAVAILPDNPDFLSNLGVVYLAVGQLDEAVASYRQAIAIKPGYGEVHNNLGNALQAQGQLDEAVTCYRQAIALKPGYAEAHNNLGIALEAQGLLDEAVASYRQALALNPEYAEAHNNLGKALQAQGRLDEAAACYRQALALNPEYVNAHNNLGSALKAQGQLDEAVASYRQAIALKPGYATAHTNLLSALQYRAGVTLSELADAHAEFEQRHAAPLRATRRPHSHSRDPDRRLRLGFVSADLGRHPVGYFLIKALEHLDQKQVELLCYSDRVLEDDLTARFQAVSTTWRQVVGWNDERLAEQIREDRIDILIDLAGHTAGNRLLVFARKPAPIQITWLGYVGTTGLTSIDYLIADNHEIPSDAESCYQEQILRMPDGYVCYDPPNYALPVSSLPALERGFVTFGCFNNPAKLTATVIEVWARILQRVPNSRLVLKFGGMSDSTVSGRLADLFACQGIDSGRVEFLSRSPHGELLSEYGRIDLALDSFPYCGGLTTCEALWMGVPVVTCPGETFASRHSLSHLSNVGLTETIACDFDEYVELAVGFANDLDRLAGMRARLRQQVAASPLCDGPRFAANLMDRLRDVWRQWVESGPA